jgi:hypothetical protein
LGLFHRKKNLNEFGLENEEKLKKLSKMSESDKWGFTITFIHPNVQCDYCSRLALIMMKYENVKFVCCREHEGNAVNSIDFAYKQKKAREKKGTEVDWES